MVFSFSRARARAVCTLVYLSLTLFLSLLFSVCRRLTRSQTSVHTHTSSRLWHSLVSESPSLCAPFPPKLEYLKVHVNYMYV